jgi:hypothetical protein
MIWPTPCNIPARVAGTPSVFQTSKTTFLEGDMVELQLAEVTAEEATQVYRLRSNKALRKLPAATRKVARLFDGRRTLLEVCDEAGISMTHGLTIVEKLAGSGVLLPIVPEAAFSTQEEAFFASELRPDDELEEPAVAPRWRPLGVLVDRLRDRLEVGLLAARDSSPSVH